MEWKWKLKILLQFDKRSLNLFLPMPWCMAMQGNAISLSTLKRPEISLSIGNTCTVYVSYGNLKVKFEFFNFIFTNFFNSHDEFNQNEKKAFTLATKQKKKKSNKKTIQLWFSMKTTLVSQWNDLIFDILFLISLLFSLILFVFSLLNIQYEGGVPTACVCVNNNSIENVVQKITELTSESELFLKERERERERERARKRTAMKGCLQLLQPEIVFYTLIITEILRLF